MKCKYCQAELESNSSVCPKCGKDNLKDDLKALKIVALSLVCVVMVLVLAGMVNYGVTGHFLPEWMMMTEEKKLDREMNKVIATAGDHKLTNREFQIYYWNSVQNTEGDFDLKKDLAEQIKDEKTGQSWEEFFIEEALDAWHETMVMFDAAVAADYKLPEEYQETLDGMEAQLESIVKIYATQYQMDLETVDDLVQMQYGAGSNFDAYYDYIYHYYMGGLYWDETLDGLEITEEQIENYFKENEEALKNNASISITKDFGNVVDIRNILIPVGTKEVENEDGEKEKVEDWETCLKDAQALLDEWLAGDKTAESFGVLAEKNSKDSGSASNGGLYTDLYAGTLMDVDVRHILLMPQGATSSTINTQEFSEEAWNWAKDEAQKVLDEWLAGDKTEDSFAELAKKYSKDGSASKGGLYEDVALGKMVEPFEDWCFDQSRQTGDYGIVKTQFGYHVMYFVRADREADDWCFDADRKSGDYGLVKTDLGYQILYFQDAEAAWHRYCTYGVRGEISTQRLEEGFEKSPIKVERDKLQVTDLAV